MIKNLKQIIICFLCFLNCAYSAPFKKHDFKRLKDQFDCAITIMQNNLLAQADRQNACREAQNIVQQLRDLNKSDYILPMFGGFVFDGISTADITLNDQTLNAKLDQIRNALVRSQDRFIIPACLPAVAASPMDVASERERVAALEEQVLILQQRLTAVRSELVVAHRGFVVMRDDLDNLRVQYRNLVAENRKLRTVDEKLRGCLVEVGQQLKELMGELPE